MNLEQAIGELLYRHDCVIIPEFGGFVTNYHPAQVHPTQHTFSPPSKSIVFNRSLKNNDGLLANHLVQLNLVNYQEACQQIKVFAGMCSATLNQGKRLTLASIGTLFLDIEKNIQFEPDPETNYLLDSFGLAEIQSPSIKRDNFVKRLEKEPKDREVVPAEVKRKVNVRRLVVMTLAAGVLFAGVWIPLKTDLLKGINYANLNPFGSKEKTIYNEAPFTAPSISPAKLRATSVITDGTDTTRYQKLSFSKADTTPVVVKLLETAEPESTAVASHSSEKVKEVVARVAAGEKFSIIGGCFAIPDNASRFIEKLRAEGFQPFLLQTNSPLRHVSYGTYSTYQDAVAMLAKVRATNKDAWILIR